MKKISLFLFAALILTSCKAQILSTSDAMTQDDPVWGDPQAPITMVVFSDFECPYCLDYFETVESLQEDWVDTGKLKVQYRDFPLASHINALPAHAAANAAGQQGKYLEMHRKLFLERDRWVYSTDPETALIEMAVELDLDKEQFRMDLKDEEVIAEIVEDRDDGRELGVRGTPGTFINDQIYQGALSREDIIGELEKLDTPS